jgi:HEAT repeat protein
MFDAVKSWLRPRDSRLYGGETAFGWTMALRDGFAHTDRDSSIAKLRELPFLRSNADLPVLISIHRDSDARILACVLAAIDARTDCHDALLAALNDPVEAVRRAAAIALFAMDTITGLAAVVAGNRHGRGIRTRAANRLAEHGPSAAAAIPALFTLISHDDINWRSHFAARAALVAIGEPALPYLRQALENGVGRTRHEAAAALKANGAPVELRGLVDEILGAEFEA